MIDLSNLTDERSETRRCDAWVVGLGDVVKDSRVQELRVERTYSPTSAAFVSLNVLKNLIFCLVYPTQI